MKGIFLKLLNNCVRCSVVFIWMVFYVLVLSWVVGLYFGYKFKNDYFIMIEFLYIFEINCFIEGRFKNCYYLLKLVLIDML